VSDVRNRATGNVLGNEGAQRNALRRIFLAPGQPDLAKNDPITNPPGPDVMHPPASASARSTTSPPPAPAPPSPARTSAASRSETDSTRRRSHPDTGESMANALKRVQKDQRPLYATGVRITAPTETAIRIDGYTERGALELFQKDSDQDIVWWSP
jgi:hypothetical protein